MKRSYSPIIIVVILALAIGLAFSQFSLPKPLSADSPEDQFSAKRAIEILEPLVQQPHPAGSPELEKVRTELVNHLEELGLQVEIYSTTGTLPQYNVAGYTQNIVARLPGTQSSGALLLIAHYDSVPQGPGAGDNGSGVVTILESLRALQNDLPLRNDILVLFSDAEEYGTLGAQAFVAQHPWMGDVSLVLNIEGTLQGSVVLVETGPENGWFVRNFRQASPYALGYSWLYDLFGVMPNLTDFLPFREAGLAGGNLFSFNGGVEYHTPMDTIENIDLGSLQQHGEQTLALLQHFGQEDLTNPHSGDVIYFNFFKNWMVIYPVTWALPLAVLSMIVLGWTLWRNIQFGQLSYKQLAAGLLFAFANIIVSLLLVMVLWMAVKKLDPQLRLYFPAHTYNDEWYAVGCICLAAAYSLGLTMIYLRKIGWRGLLSGSLMLVGITSIPISIYLPGFSYLFTWSLAVAVIPLWLPIWAYNLVDLKWVLGTGLLAIPLIFLWLPMGAILYWSSGLDFLPAIVLTVVMPILLMSIQVDQLRINSGWIVSGILTLACVLCMIVGGFRGIFTSEHPMPLRVQYFLNAYTGEANWINPVGVSSNWQAQFFENRTEEVSWTEIFPPFQSTIMKSPAKAVELAPPVVRVIEDFAKGKSRQVMLHITPARGGDQLILAFAPGVKLYSVMIDGEIWKDSSSSEFEVQDSWDTFYYAAPPEDGIDVLLAVESGSLVSFLLAERSVGLDSLPGLGIDPSPNSILSLGDYVYVSQSFRLAAEDE